jgi:hypothetical protein
MPIVSRNSRPFSARRSSSLASVGVLLKGCLRRRIEGKFVRLLVLVSCHEDVLGQRSDSSTHSSLRYLYESGELHVPDHFTPGFVTVVIHWKGAISGLDPEKSLLLS